MESPMAESVPSKHWYLAVGDRSIGPLTTELVAKGIASGKVPLTAWICQVGASSWSALSSLGEFQDIVDRLLDAEVPANQQSGVRANGATASRSVAASHGARSPAEAQLNIEAGRSEQERGDSFGGDRDAESGDLLGVGMVDEMTSRDAYPTSSQTDPQTLPAFTMPDDENSVVESHAAIVLPYEYEPSHNAVTVAQDLGESDFVTSAGVLGTTAPAVRDEMPSAEEVSGQREAVRNNAAPFDLRSNSNGDDEPLDPAVVAARAAARVSHDDLGIDITFDEDHEVMIDWKERFQSYFLVGTDVELPEEERLLQSLRETPRATFLHDEALWNLSLCLAFGSDEVAVSSAQTFFEAVGRELAPERIEWICRTLLSKGFMPSGIPRSAGMRGIYVLRDSCPEELLEVFEREAVD